MAYPTGWGRKCAIVIQSSQVSASLTDFPLLLTEDTLPSEMFDADGSYPALNGGGDIRFSSDADGNTQLACEIVSFVTDNNPTNGKAEIWVKVPSVSSSANTTIYVWYNKSGESQPISSDTYGSEAVWNSNYKAVWHMQEASGTREDSTSNGNDLLDSTSAVTADGKFGGKALSLNGTSNFLNIPSASQVGLDLANDYTISCWFYSTGGAGTLFIRDHTGEGDLVNYRSLSGGTSSGYNNRIGGSITTINTSGVTIGNNQYYNAYFYKRSSGNGQEIYIDNVSRANSANTGDNDTGNYNFRIGGRQYSGSLYPFGGRVDEFRIVSSVLSDGWRTSEYNNQNSPSTFAVEGTPETPGGGVTVSFLSQIIMS